MIFQYTLDQIRQGKKTQTRRIAKNNEQPILKDDKIDGVKHGGRIKWRVGGTYAIQPSRTAKAVGRMCIISIRHERADAISEADAIAEGYANQEEFFEVWRSVHGADKFGLMVWALEFEVIEFKDEDGN